MNKELKVAVILRLVTSVTEIWKWSVSSFPIMHLYQLFKQPIKDAYIWYEVKNWKKHSFAWKWIS